MASHPEVLIALRRARDLTDRDFAQPLTLDSMAQAAHLSKFHFARAFTKAYGETPRTYLTRLFPGRVRERRLLQLALPRPRGDVTNRVPECLCRSSAHPGLLRPHVDATGSRQK